jgi:hypothetical protein
VPREREVRAFPVQHEVEEQGGVASGRQRPDHVVLAPEGDEDVLDGVVEPEGSHHAQFRPDDLGVAGRRDIQVEPVATTRRTEGHPAVVVDERRADGAGNVPIGAGWVCKLQSAKGGSGRTLSERDP